MKLQNKTKRNTDTPELGSEYLTYRLTKTGRAIALALARASFKQAQLNIYSYVSTTTEARDALSKVHSVASTIIEKFKMEDEEATFQIQKAAKRTFDSLLRSDEEFKRIIDMAWPRTKRGFTIVSWKIEEVLRLDPDVDNVLTSAMLLLNQGLLFNMGKVDSQSYREQNHSILAFYLDQGLSVADMAGAEMTEIEKSIPPIVFDDKDSEEGPLLIPSDEE